MKIKAALFGVFGLVSILHLIGIFFGIGELSRATKPLLLVALIIALLVLAPRRKSAIVILGALGLFFSWLGDLALMMSGGMWFLTGLGLFFVAHIFYVALFARHTVTKPFQWWSLLYAVWWIVLVWVLAPHLGDMLIPVIAYGLILGLMGVFAARGNAFLAVGGALFAISDSILALNRFVPKELLTIPSSGFWVMLTYILAQGLITYGILKVLAERKAREAAPAGS